MSLALHLSFAPKNTDAAHLWIEPDQCSVCGLFSNSKIHRSMRTDEKFYSFTTCYIHCCYLNSGLMGLLGLFKLEESR